MDLRERQKIRRQKRRRKRQAILAAFIAVIVLIAVICVALSKGGKNDTPAQNNEAVVQTEIQPPAENAAEESEAELSSEEIVAGMSLDDKIMQLFVVSADDLTGVENSTVCGSTTKQAIIDKPVAGLVYQKGNMETKDQLESMISDTQAQYTEENGFPLFIVAEEEGGAASPIADSFGGNVGDMSKLSSDEEFESAENAGAKIGAYMKELKFNMNLAPTLGIGEETKYFGNDAETVASAGAAFGGGMLKNGVIPVYKAFPGNVTSQNTDDLANNELLPFQIAVGSGAAQVAVIVSSDRAPVLTGNNEPCYASYTAVTDTLRGELGFSGVIITAPLLDDATAVSALEAGCDLLLMPKDLAQATAAVKQAVDEGKISEERINQSVKRIIDLKLSV